jgi:hypothetical protein
MPNEFEKVGEIDERIIKALGLTVAPAAPIYIGQSNIAHMQTSHPADYAKYCNKIPSIIKEPDYIRLNPKDGSIEYVKEFKTDNEYVKVAVRVSGQGVLFARSLYVLNNKRVLDFISKGTLKKP